MRPQLGLDRVVYYGNEINLYTTMINLLLFFFFFRGEGVRVIDMLQISAAFYPKGCGEGGGGGLFARSSLLPSKKRIPLQNH